MYSEKMPNVITRIYALLKKEVDFQEVMRLSNCLSSERQKRFVKYRFESDKLNCFFAEFLLRHALLEQEGLDTLPDIIKNDYGKPEFAGDTGIHFNISHSGDWILVALSGQPIGVDVEKKHKAEKNIIRQFFTEEEQNWIFHGLERERDERFTRVWTLKESYLKYLGVGLSKDLSSFSVIPGKMKEDAVSRDYLIADVRDLDKREDHSKDKAYPRLFSFQLGDDYFGAFCNPENGIGLPEVRIIDGAEVFRLKDKL